MSQTSEPFISTPYTRLRDAYHRSDQSKFATDTTRYIAELEKRISGERAWVWAWDTEGTYFVVNNTEEGDRYEEGDINEAFKWPTLKALWEDAGYWWRDSASPMCVEKQGDSWVVVDI